MLHLLRQPIGPRKRLVAAIGELTGRQVPDVACGPGIVTRALAEQAHEVMALDLAPEMLDKASERCIKARLSNVVKRPGHGADLP